MPKGLPLKVIGQHQHEVACVVSQKPLKGLRAARPVEHFTRGQEGDFGGGGDTHIIPQGWSRHGEDTLHSSHKVTPLH